MLKKKKRMQGRRKRPPRETSHPRGRTPWRCTAGSVQPWSGVDNRTRPCSERSVWRRRLGEVCPGLAPPRARPLLPHSPMDLQSVIACTQCVVAAWTLAFLLHEGVGEHNASTAPATAGLAHESRVRNFKCNVYENQSEPCILLHIYFF